MHRRRHLLRASLVCFAIAIMLLLVLLHGCGMVAAQGGGWHIVDVLAADYDCDCWRLESTGQQVAVTWDAYGHRFGDGARYYVTGAADELPGMTVVFVSQRDSQHGVVALVVSGDS